MRLTTKTAALAAAMAGATLASAGSANAQDAEVTIRCHHFLSPMGSVPRFFIEPWGEKVEEDSNGRINVEIYPAMQLGGTPPSLYDQVRDGVVDCVWTIPAYTPGRFPEAEAMELPFMTSMSGEASSRAAWDFAQEHLADRFEGVRLLAAHVHGPGVIHTTNAPIETIEDFDGLQLRGPSRMANALLEELGATPVGMPVPAFPEALSRGTVDGGVIPWEVVPALRVEELAENHTQIGGDRALYNTFFIWAMNQDTYDSLPEDLQAVIDQNSGVEVSAWAGRAMDEGDDLAETAIRERGNTIVTLDEDVVGQLREVGELVTQRWIEEMTALGLDGEELVEDARALVSQYSGE